ncbi:Fungal transcriptional regulatory protein [Beauveria brongniartii RCEF 3172]|uniref:Fungal transcriptional regulatory protein n=1 Tax=Beauveria brongniartii RCEF 3172 TaxID=1081107 RepID=A0A166VPZ0_9HYPO|nr:Fungal transcriptional regulatory protein [Beauveria brongniartii RCEF 3172]
MSALSPETSKGVHTPHAQQHPNGCYAKADHFSATANNPAGGASKAVRQKLEGGKALQGLDQSSNATKNQDPSSAEGSTTSQDALQRWISGMKSSDADVTGTPPNADNMEISSVSMPGGVPSIVSPISRNISSGPWSCFDHLLSWRSCHPTFQDRNKVTSTSLRSSVELSLPPAPVDTYGVLSQVDKWTQTGWTCAHIRHLFDVLITWDSTAFILLRKDEFLQEYEEGSTRYCSSALVHALLALSMHIVDEKEDESDVLTSGWLGSKWFLLRTKALLRSRGSDKSLPDIQATGILALYHFRCGREAEAIKLAETCSSSIRALCHTAVNTSDEQYFKVRATTYCGALSLLRMLYLITGIVFSEITGELLEDGFILDQLPYSRAGTETATTNVSAGTTPSLQLASSQLLIVKLFQLTEWVYTFIVANRRAPHSNQDEMMSIYTKCLGWYRDLFELIGRDGSRTPSLLFVHMYYHFCLFSVFRSLMNTEYATSELRPHDICAQAVQSILSLTQSYNDLFTLQRVSAMIPYFVCASGLFSLAVEDSGSHMDFAQLRPLAAVDPQAAAPAKSGVTPITSDTTSPAQVKVSAVTRARLLYLKWDRRISRRPWLKRNSNRG